MRRLRARTQRGRLRLQLEITDRSAHFARLSASPHTGFLLAAYPFFVLHAFTHDESRLCDALLQRFPLVSTLRNVFVSRLELFETPLFSNYSTLKNDNT